MSKTKKNKINAIDVLLGAVSSDRAREALGVVHFCLYRDKPVAVATDGHRISILEVGEKLTPGNGVSLLPD